MLAVSLLILDALVNLITWIAVALCLVVTLALALWYGMKVLDKVHAVLWQRRIRKAVAAREAYITARDQAMGNYAPRRNAYVRLRYNEFHVEAGK